MIGIGMRDKIRFIFTIQYHAIHKLDTKGLGIILIGSGSDQIRQSSLFCMFILSRYIQFA